MGKRIVILPFDRKPGPAEPSAALSFEPGKDRRSRSRRNGLPRRIRADRRKRGRYDTRRQSEQREMLRRATLSDRRRRRDRRFGLDPTLYDRLADLDL